MLSRSFNPVLKHPLLNAMGKELGKSAAQVALRWALQHGVAVIPRSTHAARMRGNLDLQSFRLSDAQMAQIDALDGTNPRTIRLPPPPPLPCENEHEMCERWAGDGECEANPGFMHHTCAGSCNTCAHKKEL